MSLNTRVKGLVSADEVSALKSKYDEPLNRDDYFKYVLTPGLLVGAYALVTTYYWWLVVIGILVGGYYGFKYILPAIIKQDYHHNSLVERDSFCVNMTQIMSDPTRTMSSALGRAVNRSKGELKGDLRVLQANVTGSNKEQTVKAFGVLREKYKEDVSFTQYLEQLETIYLEGKTNLESLKDISTQHQDIMKKQQSYQEQKDAHWKGVKRMIMMSFGILLVLEFSFGFKISFESFCRSLPGWVTSAIYVGIILLNLTSFRKIYFDDDVMSIRRKVKG